MSLLQLPSELLFEILSPLVHPRWVNFGKSHRDQVASLRLVNKKINEFTTVLAFRRLALRHDMNKLSPEGVALLIKEKDQADEPGTFLTLISRVRAAARRVFQENDETNMDIDEGGGGHSDISIVHSGTVEHVVERYVTAFIDAVICYMGAKETCFHIMEQNIPEEAMLYGAKLSDLGLLMVATVWLGDRELIPVLLHSKKLDARKSNKMFIIAQYLACIRGDYEMVQLIKRLGNPHPNTPCGYLGNCIKAAAWGGNIDIVGTMINWGANVNSLGVAGGSSPLCVAVRSGKIGVIRLLLDAGADISARDMDFQSALSTVSAGGPSEIRALSTVGPNGTPEMRANSTFIMKLLLEYESADNALFEKERALHGAMEEGDEELIKLLLKNGVNYIDVLERNASSLSFFKNSEKEEVMKILLEYGASVEEERPDWVLKGVIRYPKPDLAKQLIGEMEDSKLLDPKSYRFLTQAVIAGNAAAVESLLKRGVPVTALDSDIWTKITPVQCHQSHAAMVNMLMERGVKRDFQLLKHAVQYGPKHIVKTILEQHFEAVSPRLDRPVVGDIQLPIDLSIVRMLLKAGVGLSNNTIPRLFSTAALQHDFDMMRELLTRYPEYALDDLWHLEPHDPILRVNGIILVHHTRMTIPESKRDALMVFEAMGDDVIKIAQLLDETQATFCQFRPIATVIHAVYAENTLLLKFFLRYYPHLITDHNLDTLMRSVNPQIRQIVSDRRRELISEGIHIEKGVTGRRFRRLTSMPLMDDWDVLNRLYIEPRESTWAQDSDIEISASPKHGPFNKTETVMRIQMAHGYLALLEKYGPAQLLSLHVDLRKNMMVHIFLDLGVDVNTPLPTFGSALAMAQFLEDDEMVTLLMSAGADPTLTKTVGDEMFSELGEFLG